MSDDEKQEDLKTVVVENVTVKVPEFMESAVTGWFKIVESQFTLRGITKSETKFLHLITNLPAQVVAKIPETVLAVSSYARSEGSDFGNVRTNISLIRWHMNIFNFLYLINEISI